MAYGNLTKHASYGTLVHSTRWTRSRELRASSTWCRYSVVWDQRVSRLSCRRCCRQGYTQEIYAQAHDIHSNRALLYDFNYVLDQLYIAAEGREGERVVKTARIYWCPEVAPAHEGPWLFFLKEGVVAQLL